MEPLQSTPDIERLLAGAVRICPGVVEALLVDSEGALVDVHAPGGGSDPAVVAGETMAAVPALGRVAAAARLGRPSEWLMVGERGTLLVHRVGRLELFLILCVTAQEYVGRARFAARVVAGRLLEIL